FLTLLKLPPEAHHLLLAVDSITVAPPSSPQSPCAFCSASLLSQRCRGLHPASSSSLRFRCCCYRLHCWRSCLMFLLLS
ncbi:hypothetical protein S245_064594, partial [Arachis hypogaea]